jgi:uridine kinase
MDRVEAIEVLVEMIGGLDLGRPVRVGIDGLSCAGKTVLADELVAPLEGVGRQVIRASLDGFHNPRAVRHRQGRDCPQGYYEDSFDYAGVVSNVLAPLGPEGDRRYCAAQFDFRTDSPVACEWALAGEEAVLIFEGVMLLRPELLPHWDFTVYVDADAEVVLERAFARDGGRLGAEAGTRAAYEGRYLPAQELYNASACPLARAHVVLENNNPAHPELIVNRMAGEDLGVPS